MQLALSGWNRLLLISHDKYTKINGAFLFSYCGDITSYNAAGFWNPMSSVVDTYAGHCFRENCSGVGGRGLASLVVPLKSLTSSYSGLLLPLL